MQAKQPVNPVVAAIVIVLVVIVAGYFIWRSTGRRTMPGSGPTIPAEVQQEFQRRGAAPTGGGAQGPGAVGMPPGVPTGPPGQGR